jgi:putative DNA primase/helicase
MSINDSAASGQVMPIHPAHQVPQRSVCAFDPYTNQSRWIVWRREPQPKGPPRKIPYAPTRSPSCRKAAADDPRKWGTLHDAMQSMRHILPGFEGGCGVVLGNLGDGFALGGIDLDTCRLPDGSFEPWAQEFIDRFGSYTEISPSRTGAKIFFLYRTKDLPEILAAMGGAETGKQYKRKDAGEHPPGCELYISKRYFTVTLWNLPDTPDKINVVDVATILWVLREAGPRFVAGGRGAAVAPSKTTGTVIDLAGRAPAIAAGRATKLNIALQPNLPVGANDESRSGIAFRMAREMKREGKTFEAFCDRAKADPSTAEWYVEKGVLIKNRELRRAWDRAETNTVVGQSGAPAPPIRCGAPFSQLPHIMDEAAAEAHLKARLFKAND